MLIPRSVLLHWTPAQRQVTAHSKSRSVVPHRKPMVMMVLAIATTSPHSAMEKGGNVANYGTVDRSSLQD